jgi:hypothetical protein
MITQGDNSSKMRAPRKGHIGNQAKPGGPLGKKDSRTMPNKGGSGAAKKHVMPAQYKFKWPSVTSAYDARGMDSEVQGGAQGARGGGLMGINFPDEQVRVSGRKGVKRAY